MVSMYHAGGPWWPAAGTWFMQGNVLGSSTLVTNESGGVSDDVLFYPWGQMWTYAGALQENHFAGSDYRYPPDLDPTQFRNYSSTKGRWLSPDPAGLSAVHPDDPQTWNMYAYVRNNPTTLTDPSGKA